LEANIEAACVTDLRKKSRLDKVILDTAVMPKRIAHPTNSRPLEKSRKHLIDLASEHGIELRQNYNGQVPRISALVGRYTHANQYRRMQKGDKAITTRV
jgi:IS5 family transposase